MQVSLAGNMGESLGNESVAAVQTIVKDLPPPPGVKTFVTGGSAMQTDQQKEGSRSIQVVKNRHRHRHHLHAAVFSTARSPLSASFW